jgi:hypothetical protein
LNACVIKYFSRLGVLFILILNAHAIKYFSPQNWARGLPVRSKRFKTGPEKMTKLGPKP